MTESNRVTSLNPFERETIINVSDGDELTRIWTCQRRFITKLRKDRRFTQTDSGHHGTTEWAAFTIPAELWNPVAGAKRKTRPLTAEEKARRAEILRESTRKPR
jgi:hypothetical protein